MLNDHVCWVILAIAFAPVFVSLSVAAVRDLKRRRETSLAFIDPKRNWRLFR